MLPPQINALESHQKDKGRRVVQNLEATAKIAGTRYAALWLRSISLPWPPSPGQSMRAPLPAM